MTNSLSKPIDDKVAERIRHHVKSFPPPISFARSKKSKEKKESSDYREFEMLLDPSDNTSQKTKKSALMFEEGDPETWCEWRKQTDELCRLMDATTIAKKEKVITGLLRGRALANFNTYKQKHVDDNANRSTPWTAEKILQMTLNDMALEIFPSKHSYRRQTFYMKYNLFIGEGTTVKQFENRITWLNQSLKYFPLIKLRNGQYKECKPLEEEVICDIINIAKKPEWTAKMMESNVDPYDLTLTELIEYLERLEVVDSITKRNTKRPANDTKKRSRKNRDEDHDSDSSDRRKKKERKRCPICKKFHKGKCRYADSSSRGSSDKDYQKDTRYKLGSGSNQSQQRTYSIEEVQDLVRMSSMLISQDNQKKRRAVSDDDKSINMMNMLKLNSKRNDYSDEDSIPYLQSYAFGKHRSVKRAKTSHKCSEVLVRIPTSNRLLRVLLDSGTSSSIVHKRFTDPSMLSSYKTEPVFWNTMGGTFKTRRKAKVTFQLAEFSLRKKITWSFHVDESDENQRSQYDMIIGDDILQHLQIDLMYSTQSIVWEQTNVPMKEKGTFKDPHLLQMAYAQTLDLTSKPLRKAEERRIRILDTDASTYSKVDLNTFVKTLSHLTRDQQIRLATALTSCPVLFSGGLATAKVQPIELELKPGSKPYHIRQPFSIPEVYRPVTKKEINRLCQLGVLEKRNDSEWACGTFIVPKKTGDVRVVTDFRMLNSMLVRRPFPIPKIKDLLSSLQGFTYASAIDLSMGYYSIPLSEQSQQLTSFMLPWGKYRYKRMPMGIKVGTDCFQETMSHVLGDLPYCKVYLDDVLLLTNGTFDDHCQKLQVVLQRLDNFNFRCRPDKCHFGVTEIEYLGYMLNKNGLTPQPKKVEAIHRMAAPTTKKALRRFLGMINYYRDMWSRRSHILAPLTALTSSKAEFKWTDEQQASFDAIKRVIARETMLSFPDFAKPFHVYTDASDYQLGGVIMQENKPLAFYSRKLNSAQKNYTTAEKELLSIVEILREFRDILFGQQLTVHTDHKNLLYRSFPSQRIMRWRMLLEEYDANYEHVKGVDNVVADGISRHPMSTLDNMEKPMDTEPSASLITYAISRIQRDESINFSSKVDRFDMAHTYVNIDDMSESDFPLHPPLLQKHQLKDKTLQRAVSQKPKDYSTSKVERVKLITSKEKICVPTTLQSRIIAWIEPTAKHNRTVVHVAKDGTTDSGILQTCPTCQKWKRQRKKYGHLPPKEAESDPWTQVHVDMMGPLTVTDINSKKHSFLAFTAIDPATGWFECVPVTNKQSFTVMDAFHNSWLCRYPRPLMIRFDNGTEFKSVFEEMCENYGLEKKPTTTYNPRSNGIIERIHQVLRDNLATFELNKHELPEDAPFDSFVAAASWAIRSSFHSTLQATPGQLVFARDMLLGLPFRADWAGIRLRKQNLIDKGVVKENRTRIAHDYSVGDKVLYTVPGILPKMNQPRTGPWEITRVFVNGTVSIKRGAISDRVNIRLITPFFE